MEILVTESLRSRSRFFEAIEVGEVVQVMFSTDHLIERTYVEIQNMSTEILIDRIKGRSYFFLCTREECYRYLVHNTKNDELWNSDSLNMNHELAKEIALYFPIKAEHPLQHCKISDEIKGCLEHNLYQFVDFAPLELIRDIYPITLVLNNYRLCNCYCGFAETMGIIDHEILYHAFEKRKLSVFEYLLEHFDTISNAVMYEATLKHEHEYISYMLRKTKLDHPILDMYHNACSPSFVEMNKNEILNCKTCVDIHFSVGAYELYPDIFNSCENEYVKVRINEFERIKSEMHDAIISGDQVVMTELFKSRIQYTPQFCEVCEICEDKNVDFVKWMHSELLKRKLYRKINYYDILQSAIKEKKSKLATFILNDVWNFGQCS